jgi:hypothetical protein
MATVEMATGNEDAAGKSSRLEVLKEYPARGALQQFRLTKVTKFTYSRYNKDKTAKLVVTKDGNWESLMCNGCYGFMLSQGGEP